MTLREAAGRISSFLHPDPLAEVDTERSAASTKISMLTFHLLFAASWFVAEPDLLGSLLVWFVLQVGVFAGYHRYFSHRSFKTHPWFEVVLALLGSIANQGGLHWWVSEHRHHHRVADTDQDFHSPRDGFWHSHMGWLWSDDAVHRINWKLIPDLRRPHLLWVSRNDLWIKAAYAASLALIFGWSGVLNYWVVPVVLGWHTSLATNSFCHTFGSHPEECRPRESCEARNNALVAYLNLGEGWHNNHHAHPSWAHHGFHRWYELDVVYLVLLVLEKLGVIWDVQRRPTRPDGRKAPATANAV
jgi:stearoyl-CoA desaturase (Delta-9 desaturase)